MRRAGPRSSLLSAGLAAGLILGAIGLGAAIGSNVPSLAGVLVAATALAVASPIATRFMRGQHVDLLEPLVLYVFAFGTMFVLRPAYMLAVGADGYYSVAGSSIDISSTFVKMQALALLAAITFGTAYELTLNRGRSVAGTWSLPEVPRISFPTLRLGAVVLLVGGALGTVLRVRASGGLGLVLTGRSTDYFAAQVAASKYLLYAPIPLVASGLLFFALWLYSRRARDAAGFLACFALMVVAFGFTGGRIQFLPFVLSPVVYYFLSARKRPRLRSVVVGLVVALAVSTVVGQSRNADVRQETGIVSAMTEVIRSPVTILEPLTEGQDAAQAPALAAALTVIPDPVAHTYGLATVGDFLVRVVPRTLWDGKPIAARESVVRTIWGEAYYSGTANPEFSAILSWYLDAGAFGVAIGFALYGLIFAWFFRYAQRRGGTVESALVFAAALPLGVRALRDSPTDVAAQALFIIAPIALTVVIARRVHARNSSPSSHS